MKKNDSDTKQKTEKRHRIQEHKRGVISSPDINKMQLVFIDERTQIYISKDADPEEAKLRYKERENAKWSVYVNPHKKLAPKNKE
jgi:hypothetical protein